MFCRRLLMAVSAENDHLIEPSEELASEFVRCVRETFGIAQPAASGRMDSNWRR